MSNSVPNVVVTGADRGIGEALCHAYLKRGARVFAACLDDSPALRDAGAVVVSGVDVTSASKIEPLVRAVADQRVDILIHNAGIVAESPLGAFAFDGFEREYAVNALGPLRVTQALLSALCEGAKIGIITSRVGSLGENQSGGLYGYRMSKAAANMATICLAHDVKQRGIAVMALHPGSVLTAMTRALTDQRSVGNFVEPAIAAQGLIARLDELNLATSGTFRHANGDLLPW
ncbi:MAG: SDR family oxidoreductase [Gammaproteobacteria bacterium]